ncbi:hypothetical protein H072_3689 [Dactylellina haptotyla CBS 200.50]|uniref:Fimbrin n=1 Tax=Dactylellina haptotyla (strain CBS 200.50) TaxID=1284197 RepID=S8BSD4_DACHA|nr:hypothetical protein H072_3689 [Dactylellina haptotyla CBS 200.50]
MKTTVILATVTLLGSSSGSLTERDIVERGLLRSSVSGSPDWSTTNLNNITFVPANAASVDTIFKASYLNSVYISKYDPLICISACNYFNSVQASQPKALCGRKKCNFANIYALTHRGLPTKYVCSFFQSKLQPGDAKVSSMKFDWLNYKVSKSMIISRRFSAPAGLSCWINTGLSAMSSMPYMRSISPIAKVRLASSSSVSSTSSVVSSTVTSGSTSESEVTSTTRSSSTSSKETGDLTTTLSTTKSDTLTTSGVDETTSGSSVTTSSPAATSTTTSSTARTSSSSSSTIASESSSSSSFASSSSDPSTSISSTRNSETSASSNPATSSTGSSSSVSTLTTSSISVSETSTSSSPVSSSSTTVSDGSGSSTSSNTVDTTSEPNSSTSTVADSATPTTTEVRTTSSATTALSTSRATTDSTSDDGNSSTATSTIESSSSSPVSRTTSGVTSSQDGTSSDSNSDSSSSTTSGMTSISSSGEITTTSTSHSTDIITESPSSENPASTTTASTTSGSTSDVDVNNSSSTTEPGNDGSLTSTLGSSTLTPTVISSVSTGVTTEPSTTTSITTSRSIVTDEPVFSSSSTSSASSSSSAGSSASDSSSSQTRETSTPTSSSVSSTLESSTTQSSVDTSTVSTSSSSSGSSSRSTGSTEDSSSTSSTPTTSGFVDSSTSVSTSTENTSTVSSTTVSSSTMSSTAGLDASDSSTTATSTAVTSTTSSCSPDSSVSTSASITSATTDIVDSSTQTLTTTSDGDSSIATSSTLGTVDTTTTTTTSATSDTETSITLSVSSDTTGRTTGDASSTTTTENPTSSTTTSLVPPSASLDADFDLHLDQQIGYLAPDTDSYYAQLFPGIDLSDTNNGTLTRRLINRLSPLFAARNHRNMRRGFFSFVKAVAKAVVKVAQAPIRIALTIITYILPPVDKEIGFGIPFRFSAPSWLPDGVLRDEDGFLFFKAKIPQNKVDEYKAKNKVLKDREYKPKGIKFETGIGAEFNMYCKDCYVETGFQITGHIAFDKGSMKSLNVGYNGPMTVNLGLVMKAEGFYNPVLTKDLKKIYLTSWRIPLILSVGPAVTFRVGWEVDLRGYVSLKPTFKLDWAKFGAVVGLVGDKDWPSPLPSNCSIKFAIEAGASLASNVFLEVAITSGVEITGIGDAEAGVYIRGGMGFAMEVKQEWDITGDNEEDDDMCKGIGLSRHWFVDASVKGKATAKILNLGLAKEFPLFKTTIPVPPSTCFSWSTTKPPSASTSTVTATVVTTSSRTTNNPALPSLVDPGCFPDGNALVSFNTPSCRSHNGTLVHGRDDQWYQVTCGQDYATEDIEVTGLGSLGDCFDRCQEMNVQARSVVCGGVVFVPGLVKSCKSCHLKSTTPRTKQSPTLYPVESMRRVNPPTSARSCDNDTPYKYPGTNGTIFQQNCGWYVRVENPQLRVPIFTPDYFACMDLCAQDSTCRGVWYQPASQSCWMMTGIDTKYLFRDYSGGDSVAFVSDQLMSTKKVDCQYPENSLESNALDRSYFPLESSSKQFFVDCGQRYLGFDYYQFTQGGLTLEDCVKACAADSQCVAASWSHWPQEAFRCFLKNAWNTYKWSDGAPRLQQPGGGNSLNAPHLVLSLSISRSLFISIFNYHQKNTEKVLPFLSGNQHRFPLTATMNIIKLAKKFPQLRQDEIMGLQNEFLKLDQDDKGYLDEATAIKSVQALERKPYDTVRSALKEVELDSSRRVELEDFVDLVSKLRISGGTGIPSAIPPGVVRSRASSATGGSLPPSPNKKPPTGQIRMGGSTSTSQHTINEDERTEFTRHINAALAGDADIGERLPFPTDTFEMFDQCKDGLVLAKLINDSVPDTIDERVLNRQKNKKALNAFHMTENNNIVINSAKAIGCSVVNIGAGDIIEVREHLILGLIWQIIRRGLLSKIDIRLHPELYRLLEDGETLEQFLRLPPEQILLRWFNFHLKAANWGRRVNNFSTDVKDAENYTVLLNQLSPELCSRAPLQTYDLLQRAEQVLENADKLDCRKFLTAKSLVAGNPKLNLAFVAHLFNTHPCLDPLTEDEKVDIEDFDAEGEREARVFTLWLNSLDVTPSINSLFDDLSDGTIIMQAYDKVIPNSVNWRHVNKRPQHGGELQRFKAVENTNHAVELGKHHGFSLVGIQGADITDGHRKLTLALVWQLMRRDILNTLSGLASKLGKKDLTDSDMIRWANDTVKRGGKNSQIRSFKDPALGSGIFMLDVLNGMKSNYVDYSLVTDGRTDEDAYLNAKLSISIARKMGATIWLLPDDIVAVRSRLITTFVGSLMAVPS